MTQVSEADVLEQLEKMCDPDTDPGDWITQIDIVEKGSQLELKDTGAVRFWQVLCDDVSGSGGLTGVVAYGLCLLRRSASATASAAPLQRRVM